MVQMAKKAGDPFQILIRVIMFSKKKINMSNWNKITAWLAWALVSLSKTLNHVIASQMGHYAVGPVCVGGGGGGGLHYGVSGSHSKHPLYTGFLRLLSYSAYLRNPLFHYQKCIYDKGILLSMFGIINIIKSRKLLLVYNSLSLILGNITSGARAHPRTPPSTQVRMQFCVYGPISIS